MSFSRKIARMKSMKKLFFIIAMSVTASTSLAGGQFIIDPELMNKGVWAEPVFRSPPADDSRAPASQEEALNLSEVRNASQVLEVMPQIPSSEPTLSKVWLERKILNEKDSE